MRQAGRAILASASRTSLFQDRSSKPGQRWKPKGRFLNKPGGVLVAMRAASIRRVPDPQKGSAKGTVPS